MKKILMAAVALTALGATPAMAADQSATFDVKASVAASCGAITGSTLQFNTLNITGLGELGTNEAQTATQATYCNGANSTVKVTKTKMTTTATPVAGFTNTIDFEAVVTAAGKTVAADDTAHNLGAFSGDLVVTAQNLSTGTDKPLAGAYSGSIAVTLSPAL